MLPYDTSYYLYYNSATLIHVRIYLYFNYNRYHRGSAYYYSSDRLTYFYCCTGSYSIIIELERKRIRRKNPNKI